MAISVFPHGYWRLCKRAVTQSHGFLRDSDLSAAPGGCRLVFDRSMRSTAPSLASPTLSKLFQKRIPEVKISSKMRYKLSVSCCSPMRTSFFPDP